MPLPLFSRAAALLQRPCCRLPSCSRSLSTAAALPRTVAVGLSGGVDSAVSAYLLQLAGWRVEGVFMRNWDDADEAGAPACSAGDADLASAHETAAQLGIPLHVADFSRQYWLHVFAPWLEAYASGRTPNPDVLCNRHVKFGAFAEWAHATLGAPYIATGHYAQVRPAVPWWEGGCEGVVAGGGKAAAGAAAGARRRAASSRLPLAQRSPPAAEAGPNSTAPCLHAGVDPIKDQSDFLSFVPGAALRRVLFPVGALHKGVVRAIAAYAGLAPAARADSMGICFIGKRALPAFLSQYIALTPGPFLHLETGALLGRHAGAEAWTIGQRARLGGLSDKAYVVGQASRVQAAGQAHCAHAGAPGGSASRRLPQGAVLVAPSRGHASLLCDSLTVRAAAFHWVAGEPPRGLLSPRAKRAAAKQGLPPPIAWQRMRYKIRHTGDDMGWARVSIMSRRQHDEWVREGLAAGAERGASTQAGAEGREAGTAASALAHSRASHAPAAADAASQAAATSSHGGEGAATVTAEEHLLVVHFELAQRAVAAGQALVLYGCDEADERGSAGAAASEATLKRGTHAEAVSALGESGKAAPAMLPGGILQGQPSEEDELVRWVGQCWQRDAIAADAVASATSPGKTPLDAHPSPGSSTSPAVAGVGGQPSAVPAPAAGTVPAQAVDEPGHRLREAQAGLLSLQRAAEASLPPWGSAGRRCLGGGYIDAPGLSYWQRGLVAPDVWRE